MGYLADGIFDSDTPLSKLLCRNGIFPLSLLGEGEWATFQLATRKAAGTAATAAIGGGTAAWLWSRKTVRVAREVKATGGYFSAERNSTTSCAPTCQARLGALRSDRPGI